MILCEAFPLKENSANSSRGLVSAASGALPAFRLRQAPFLLYGDTLLVHTDFLYLLHARGYAVNYGSNLPFELRGVSEEHG